MQDISLRNWIVFSAFLLLTTAGCHHFSPQNAYESQYFKTDEYGNILGTQEGALSIPISLSLIPYPNPVKYELNIRFNNPSQESVQVDIIDGITGAIYPVMNRMAAVGYHKLRYPVYTNDKMIPGTYIVQLQSGTKMLAYRIDVLPVPSEVSDEIIQFAEKYYSHQRFKTYYDFIHADYYNTSDNIFLQWTMDPFSQDSVYFKEQKKKSSAYYDMIATYNQFVQGWQDALPDMVADSFQYLYSQYFATEFDYRFRGMAISEINQSGQRMDTLWMYYHPDYNTIPLWLGKSDRQQELYNMIYGSD
jgi:hypothetical protein